MSDDQKPPEDQPKKRRRRVRRKPMDDGKPKASVHRLQPPPPREPEPARPEPDDVKQPPVIELHPDKPTELRPKADLPFRLIRTEGKFCMHGDRLVCDRQRTVECNLCGAKLDPFDVLNDVARDHERFARALEHAAREVRGVNSRLEILRRLEDNARGRVRRFGIRGSKYHFDRLLDYARQQMNRPDLTEGDLDRMLFDPFQANGPTNRLRAALAALEKGAPGAALELLRMTVDELEAAHGVVQDEERRRA